MHGIVQVRHMAGALLKSSDSRVIIGAGMGDGHHRLVMPLLDQLHGALFLRRDGKQLYTIAGRFVQSVEHGDVRFVDIFAVLSPLLRKRYKRAFHVDPMEMRSVVLLTFFGVGSGRAADAVQHLLGERHGSRYDIRHAHRCFIGRHRVDGLSRAVTEVLAHAAMEMNIRKTRYGIASASIYLFLIADICRSGRKPVALYKNIPY